MRQAPGLICVECSSTIPHGHKHCGNCGAKVSDESHEIVEEYYGPGQLPGKARLLLIRGVAGVPGHDYMLLQDQHLAGGGDVPIKYSGDDWLSAKHAAFRYEDGALLVEDLDSQNGVFVRIEDEASVSPGQSFICGGHVFRAEITPKDTSGPDEDETYFYTSPKVTSPFRVVEEIEGGHDGMVCCAQGSKLRIGRYECNMNFPDDRHMSPRHASLSINNDGEIMLRDDNSNNGVYVRITEPTELKDGDYLMMGRQVLRVEFTAS